MSTINSTAKMDAGQIEFCNLDSKYIRLLAPAGAGKTLTLLYRCKRIIEKNPSEKILLFTFTRVARDELKLRLKNISALQSCMNNITISTLNSYGLRIVKNKSSYMGHYKIIEKKERIWTVVNHLLPVISKSKTIYEKMQDKRWKMLKAEKLLDMIDVFKSLGFDHERIRSESDFNAYWSELTDNGLAQKLGSILEDFDKLNIIKRKSDLYANFFKFYCAATEHLKSMNLYTMEDQKYWGWKYSDKGSKLTGAARYSHIMVDEFQDINPIDLLFIKALREQHDSGLTIVGDDDQAIFEWRGATPQYILDPDKYFGSLRFPAEFKTCILNKNYRSPTNIVELSQRLIRHNINRVEKNTIPVQTSKAKIVVEEDVSYDIVVEQISALLKQPDIRNIALISRKRSQLIPYQIILAGKEESFFAAEDLNIFLTEAFNSLKDIIEIKQVHKTRCNPTFLYHHEAIMKLCNRIRKYPLNKAERDELRNYLTTRSFESFEEAIVHLYKFSKLGKFFKDNICENMEKFFKTGSVADMIEYVGNNFVGLQKDFRKADDDIFYADPPFGYLADFARRYGDDYQRFYFDVQKAIVTLADIVHQEDDSLSDEQEARMNLKLHLMTSLRAKGKEFDAVFILNANHDVWPMKLARSDASHEAERRLFYVAITRTRKELHFLIDPNSIPSPYLSEIGLL